MTTLSENIRTSRERAANNDNEQFQEKRKKFLDFLSSNTLTPVITFEMYSLPDSEPIKSPIQNYCYFNRWQNTRVKTMPESSWEADKLPIEKTIALCCEICLALMRARIHFAVFYAEGQRSPHIRIYDLVELIELSQFQREKAQALFWRKYIPFGMFHYADAAMWRDEQPYCLEFAPHWKYGTIFNLLFEYLPEAKPNIDYPKLEYKAITRKKKDTPDIPLCERHNFQKRYKAANGNFYCPVCIMERKCSA